MKGYNDNEENRRDIMGIGQFVNSYARKYSPYMNGLVNHLPMGQLALYQMGNSLDKIKTYSKEYVERSAIDPIKDSYEEKNSIEECLGDRNSYEPCLEIVKKEIEIKGIYEVLSRVLNTYPLGLSSGLFHTTIRLAYATEGIKLDKELKDELARALAYYITAYREGGRFHRHVPASQFKDEVKKLLEDEYISNIIFSETSRGKRLKALYDDERYLDMGVVIEGNIEDKVKSLLDLLLPLLDQTNDIVILHCITGLHALLVLEKHFKNFDDAMDIMTTFITTHLLTVEGIIIDDEKKEIEYKTWEKIIKKASKSSNVHTIKLTYTTKKLYDLYKMPELKGSAIIRNF